MLLMGILIMDIFYDMKRGIYILFTFISIYWKFNGFALSRQKLKKKRIVSKYLQNY